MGEAQARMMTSMSSPGKAKSPSWKLYDNPQYTCLSKSSSSSSASSRSSRTRPIMNTNLSDLDAALSEIKSLRAELEFERRMRQKVESLNRALASELEEERRARVAAGVTCGRLAEEIAHVRGEAERAREEAEEERRMLITAEAMREERVQMKLSEARFFMEEKIKEMIVKTGDEKVKQKQKEKGNPHIKRAIKGMEFPRAVARVGSSLSPRSRSSLGSNVECQRAQLRVLMRQKSAAAAASAAESFVM